MTIGVVTGMVAEARCFNPNLPDVTVRVASASSDRAKAAALELTEAGVTGLVSFGIAGGLDQRFNAGDIIVADTVIAPDGSRISCHSEWRRNITDEVKGALPYQVATILGSDRPIATCAEKSEAFQTYGAAAVDMESHTVAAVAASKSLPLIVVRAVADTAQRNLPSSALSGVGPDGRTLPLATIRGVLRRPSELPALIRVAIDTGRALRALRDVAKLIGTTAPRET